MSSQKNNPSRSPSARELFEKCLDLNPDERLKFLAEAAAGNAELHSKVTELLQSLDDAGDFLAKPAVKISTTLTDEIRDSAMPTPIALPYQTPDGKYLLLEKLGEGGMAEVFRALVRGHGIFSKMVAVKRVHPHFSKNEKFRKLFEREARLSSILTHSNIVQVFDFFSVEDAYFLIMEYVPGRNLVAIQKKLAALPEQDRTSFATYVTAEVAKGLSYAHSKKDPSTGRPLGLIHRDISPKNIMVSFAGLIKIVDFGIAEFKSGIDETQGGGLVGTLGYLSPEQADGKACDGRTDIFAACIVLYELLAGERLFQSETLFESLAEVKKNDIVAKLQALPISQALKLILLRGLRTEPEDRYMNANDLFLDLQELLNQVSPPYTQPDLAHFMEQLFLAEIREEQLRSRELESKAKVFLAANPLTNNESETQVINERKEPPRPASKPQTAPKKTPTPAKPKPTAAPENPINDIILRNLADEGAQTTPRPPKLKTRSAPPPPPRAQSPMSARREGGRPEEYRPYTPVIPPPEIPIGTPLVSQLPVILFIVTLIVFGWIVHDHTSTALRETSSRSEKETYTKSRPPPAPPEEPKLEPRQPATDQPIADGNCRVRISTDPPGATVTVNHVQTGETPQLVLVKCEMVLDLRLELNGYQILERKITASEKESGITFSLYPTKDKKTQSQGGDQISP